MISNRFYITSEKHTGRLIWEDFKLESLSINIRRSKFNLNILNKISKRKERQFFYTKAYEQLKTLVFLDIEKSKLCESIYKGYAIAELYNIGIKYPNYYELKKGSEKTFLKEIEKEMTNVQNKIGSYKNIEEICRN